MTQRTSFLSGHKRRGLALHLAVVVACAALPALVFFLGWIESRREIAIEEAQDWTRIVAEKVADRHAGFYGEVRQTLEMISLAPTVRRAQTFPCTSLLTETQRRRDWMKSGWVVDADGTTLCATDPARPAPALSDDMQTKLASDGFVLGMIAGDQATNGLMHLVAALPIEASTVRRHLVVETTIKIDYLDTMAAVPGDAPDGAIVMAVDRQGRAIRYAAAGHDFAGEDVGAHPVVQALLAAHGKPIVGAVHDNIERIFTSAAVPRWGATVIVGVDRASVLAASSRDLAIGLAIVLAVIFAAVAIAWISADRLIMRSVRVVRDAAMATADGAFGRRAVLAGGPSEIRELADAFNRMTERLETMALNDQLTGTPNRRYLESRLRAFESDATPYALMILDVDDFKPINDRHGHAVGDLVLKELAERLVEAVGDDGFLARVGGDEFVIVVTAKEASSVRPRALVVGERIREKVAAPLHLGEDELVVTGSIGVAFRGAEVRDLVELFRNADRALYAAKTGGRNRLVVFDGTQPETDSKPLGARSSRSAA